MKKLLALLTATILVTTPVTTIVACGSNIEEEKENWDTNDPIENLGNLTFEEQSDGKILLKSDKFEFTKAGDKEILISKNKNFWLETKLYGQTSLETQWDYEIATYLSFDGNFNENLRENAIIHHNKVNDNILYVPDDILVNNWEGVYNRKQTFAIINEIGETITLTYSTIFYDFIFWYICDSMKTLMNNIVDSFNKTGELENWTAKLEVHSGSFNLIGASLNDQPKVGKTYFSIIFELFDSELYRITSLLNEKNLNSNTKYIKKIKYNIIATKTNLFDNYNWVGINLEKYNFETKSVLFDTQRGEIRAPIRIPINTILE